MEDLVSIVVPVYNVMQYLDACMESILNQSYHRIEVILVDDGSTDGSGQKCDYYSRIDSRVIVMHKENGGLSDARNKGIALAKGDYIMFVDSDDIVSLNIVDYLLGLCEQYSADISICDPVHCYITENINFEDERKITVFNAHDAIVEMLYQKSFLVAAWGKLFRRTYFDDVLFPYGMLFEDSAIMYKIFNKANVIVYGDAKLYGYMHREGSITTSKFSIRDCDIIKICQQITEDMSNESASLQAAVKSYYTAAAFRVYLNAPRNGKFEQEINECKKVLNKNGKNVIKDSNIRKKLKMALLLYLYARPFMPIVYRKINRWK